MSRKKAPYGMAEEKGLVLFVVDYGNLHVDSVLLVLWWLICICRQLIVRIKMLLFCFQYRYAFSMTLFLLKLKWQKKTNKFMFYENTRESSNRSLGWQAGKQKLPGLVVSSRLFIMFQHDPRPLPIHYETKP